MRVILTTAYHSGYLAKLTMAHGIPVGELKAGSSLSPTSLALTLNTWWPNRKIITIKKGKRQDGGSGRWGPQQPIERSGKALWRPYVPEGTNRIGEGEVTNDSDSICVLKGFLVYEATCNKWSNCHMLTTWCWYPQAGKKMLVISLPFNSFILNTDLSKHNNVIMWVNAAYIANKIILRLISSSMKATCICSSFWTDEQAFTQNLKSHNPKCAIVPAQISNFKVTCKK